MKDNIYDQEQANAPFQFDRKVTAVFEDMIRRSVPGYGLTLSMVEHLAQHFHQKGTTIYDLGSSLGASLLAASQGAPQADLIGIDNSPEMIATSREKLSPHISSAKVTLIEADLVDYSIEKQASLIILNFTLQFIPIQKRLDLLQRCYQALIPGGALILSEKIIFPDPLIQEAQTSLHHKFKKEQGYSDLEISQKRDALEKVLIPETSDTHLNRLEKAGFQHCSSWFQCFSFTSFLAIKE